MTSFTGLGLSVSILQAVERAGFTSPTAIQEQVIPHLLAGKDLVGQAQTGTGKTAAFGLPALNLCIEDPEFQVLILTPVRELAKQISDELANFGKKEGIRVVTISGGNAYRTQIDAVKKGAQIVVATPGRLMDLLSSKRIATFKPSMIILDEADEMLDKGFLEDINTILTQLPAERQTLLFSATMPDPIKHLAKRFLVDPIYVHIAKSNRVNLDISQFYSLIHHKEREDALIRLLDTEQGLKSIVFCNTKRDVDRIRDLLSRRGHEALALHGDMEQNQRARVMQTLKNASEAILVATEVAARGINVECVTHVYNYDVPFGAESYVHRIGRTGRAGKTGKAITLVSTSERGAFEGICERLKIKVEHHPIPEKNQAYRLKHQKFFDEMKGVTPSKEIMELWESLSLDLSLEEIAKRLMTVHFQKMSLSGPDQIGLEPRPWKPRKTAKKTFRNKRVSHSKRKSRR